MSGLLHGGILFPGEKHAVGDRPKCVIAADFNGDGTPDLATANADSGNVSVLMGTGGGSFAARVNLSVGGTPDTLAAADFNGDGKTDLIVADDGSSTLVLRLGNGNGTFQAATNVAGVGTKTHAVITGDFNGDGQVDLATSNLDGYQCVSILLGNGNGSFQVGRSTFTARGDANALVAADFNGDGKVDIAAPNFLADKVSVLLGNGDGTLRTAKIFDTGDRPTSVTAADFNGDGKVDIATSGNTFDEVSVLLGAGDGNFQAAQNYAVGDQPRSLAAGDFNGDGKPDLATANYNSQDVSVLLGNGNGTFQSQRRFEVSKWPWWILARDLDGDGKIDLTTANLLSAEVSILPGAGDGSFHVPRRFASTNDPRAVVAADFNRDGKRDVATVNFNSNDVGVLLGNGDGTLQAIRKFAAGNTPVAAATADFNGDEKADIVVANGNTSTDVSVLLGNGDGSFQALRRFSVGGVPSTVVAVDLNGDGKMDLATTNPSQNSLAVLIGNGDGTFQARQLFAAGSNLRGLVAGDFNRDGKKDLATANSTAGPTAPAEVSVLLGNGDGTLRTPVKSAVGDGPVAITTADFNGDGSPDLATANSSSNDLSVLLGNGDGTFEAERRIPAGNSQQAITAADFNGDGKVDLAVASAEDPHGVSVLLGIQSGYFESRRRFRSAGSAYALAATDLNGDGKTDLAAATGASEVVTLLRLGPDARNDLGRFGTGGNQGTYTIRVSGDDFGVIAGASLVGSGGFNRPALLSYWEENGEYYATFDLRGAAPGKYDVRFTTSGGGSTLVSQSLVVVSAPSAGPVIPRLIAPSAIRRGREYNFTVEWENTSLNDVVAPLISVGNTTPFGPAPKDRSCGSRYTFLGVNMHAGPPGILRPGQRESATFWADSGTEDGSYLAWADREIKNMVTSFDWAAAIRPLRPDGMTDGQVSSLATELAATYGTNKAGYLAALSAFANLEWEKTRNPDELFQREITRAWSRMTSGVWGMISGVASPSGGHEVVIEGGVPSVTRVTRADRQGRFHFSRLAAGNYSLEVEKVSLVTPAQANVVLAGSSSTGPVNLTVTPARRFVVQIDVQDGSPLNDAVVVPSRNGLSFDPVKTDGEGLAAFYGLEAGTYELSILEAEGGIRKMAGLVVPTNPPSITRVDLAGAVVRGTLPPGSQWHLALVPSGDGSFEMMPASIEAAAFIVHAPAGSYKLVAIDEDANLVAQAGPWQITAGSDINVGLLNPAPSSQTRAPRNSGARWIEEHDIEYDENGLRNFEGDVNWLARHDIKALGYSLAEVREQLVPIALWGTEKARGKEYTSVVQNFLDVDGPRYRSFSGDCETINGSDDTLGSWLPQSDRSETELELFANPGFRNHPRTRSWLNKLVEGLADPIRTGIVVGDYALEPGGKKSIDIMPLEFKQRITDEKTLALYRQSGDDPVEGNKWLVFGATLAGGVGEYGTPRATLYPDYRELEGGTVMLSRDCSGVYEAKLSNVRFHVHDAFDFWPGNLATFPTNFATTILAFMEVNDEARDVVLDMRWEQRGERNINLGGLGEESRRQSTSTCFKPDDQKSIERPASCDPNDIIGPAGVGPLHHVFADAVMPYRIRFENHATQATAPAAIVTITHHLDADLDWSTFELGSFGMGDLVVEVPPDLASYETRVDLRETHGVFVDVKAEIDMATGKATWEFMAIDPETGDLPEDPFVGFLPPNVTPPEGEGFADYKIHPKRPAVVGTRIDATASIVFDANPPILTAPIFHTLDDGPPTMELNVVQTGVGGTSISLQWSGNDRSGSGIASYDVAVSVDDGAFVPWLTNTQETQATYSGYFGQTLQFQVTARDLLGLQPSSPTVASSTIQDDGYLLWRAAKFGNAVQNPALRNSLWGDDADPDGDGESNLLEFVAATNPLQRDAGLAGALWTGGGKAVFPHRQTKTGSLTVEHRIEWSPDLQLWAGNGLVDILVADRGAYLDLEAQLGIAGKRKAFFRQFAAHRVTYPLWLHEEGVALQDSGADGDPNGDGISNAMAYAFGLPATAAASAGDLSRLPQNITLPLPLGQGGGAPQLQDWSGIRFFLPVSGPEDATLIVESGPISNAGPWRELARKTGRSAWEPANATQVKVLADPEIGTCRYEVLEPKEGARSYRVRVVISE